MQDSLKRTDIRSGDGMKVLKSKIGLFQLPFIEETQDKFLYPFLDPRRGGVCQRPAGGFHDIGQHYQSSFLGIGPWARIVILVFRNRKAVFSGPLHCFVIEKFN